MDVPAEISFGGLIFNLLFSKLPYNAVRFIDEAFSTRLIQLLDEESFDLIQLEGLYLCPYISLIRKHSRAKIAYRAHNVEYEIWERTAKLTPGLKSLYLRFLAKRIKAFEQSYLNDYDLLIPITDRDGRSLDKLGNQKPRFTSQTGIDLSILKPNTKQLEYPSLFHIGAMDWAPNQEGILWFLDQCWPSIQKKYPYLKFYLAGRNAPGWLKTKIQYRNVVFLGEIDDAYSFMNSKAIMLVPLLSGSGMRIKIIEGLALGKAIISTRVGAEGISLSNRENIILADDAHSFIAGINELIENRDFHDQLGKNAVGFIRNNFDNLALAGSLIQFYKQSIHG